MVEGETMKKFAIISIALFGLILAVAASRPSTVTVERSLIITASPAVVANFIVDLHAWEQWSPWAHRDPATKVTYGGPARGVGATSHWAGASDVGEGTLTITEEKPNALVVLTVDYTSPVLPQSRVEFELQGAGTMTNVTWKQTLHSDFSDKFFSLVMNINQLVGRDLEAGLATLKLVAEAAQKQAAVPSPPSEPASALDAGVLDAGVPEGAQSP
jgi:hypothetical protein